MLFLCKLPTFEHPIFTKAFFNAQIYFDKGQAGLELAKKYTILAQNQMQVIIDSHNKLVQENVEVPSCIFEPAIARRILATAPPNTIPLPSFEAVLSHFQNLFLHFLTFFFEKGCRICSELFE